MLVAGDLGACVCCIPLARAAWAVVLAAAIAKFGALPELSEPRSAGDRLGELPSRCFGIPQGSGGRGVGSRDSARGRPCSGLLSTTSRAFLKDVEVVGDNSAIISPQGEHASVLEVLEGFYQRFTIPSDKTFRTEH